MDKKRFIRGHRIGWVIFQLLLLLLFLSCRKGQEPLYPHKGKLITKGICLNHTIQFIGGEPISLDKLESLWVNPTDGKRWERVFRLENECKFPQSLEEGDEFWFRIVPPQPPCVKCKGYSPTPNKGIPIEVLH